jgi:hypothetical protein
MMTGLRWFVVVILVLAAGTTLVPWYLRTHAVHVAYQPKLYVSIDGKPVGRDVVLLAHHKETNEDVLIPCSKGRCHIHFSAYDREWTDTIQKLEKKVPAKVMHSTKKREAYYAQANVLWSVDITGALKKFKGKDYAIHIDSNKRTADQAETISVKPATVEPRPVTLGLSNLNKGTVQLIGVGLVILVFYLGYKFISVGGHHH